MKYPSCESKSSLTLGVCTEHTQPKEKLELLHPPEHREGSIKKAVAPLVRGDTVTRILMQWELTLTGRK